MGFLNARIQTWFPFSIQICLNGREWLARQMDAQGVRYARQDNCFPWIEDFARAQRLMEERGDQRVQVYRGAAEYLAGVNLSSRPTWNFDFKTLPRPTGAATRVLYTEYDLPRETIEPHRSRAWLDHTMSMT